MQKRLVHRNANVQLYALTLADAVAKNCGLTAHQEIASRSFTQTLARICLDRNTHMTVKKRCAALVKEWAGEFDDDSLGLMKETYESLKSQNVAVDDAPQVKPPEHTSEQLRAEDEELRRALELSLKDQGGRATATNSSTYRGEASSSATAPQTAQCAQSSASAAQSGYANQTATNMGAFSANGQSAPNTAPNTTGASRVRALYDFSPTEPGELAFARGDIIRVLDSVYEHWWRGEVRGEAGIFPVNYVEVLPDPTPQELQREAEMEARIFSQAASIDKLLNKLRSLDPARDNLADDEELQELYQTSLAMRPKIVKLIDRYSSKITELKSINDKFVRARGSFDQMMEQSLSRNNHYAAQPHQDYSQSRAGYQRQSSAEYSGHNAASQSYAVQPSNSAQSQAYAQYQQYGQPPASSDAIPPQQPHLQYQQQPEQQQPAGYATAPHDLQQGNVPYDDEKRRLYERARAESEAFQASHFQQASASGYLSGPSSGFVPPAASSSSAHGGLTQQMNGMHLNPQSHNYPSHPVGP